jgi:DNA-binding MarR family transcriptional regulator
VREDVRRVSNAIGDLMRVAGSDRVHAMRQRGAGIDLSRTEMRFLAVVADQGPMPVTELGRVLHLSQPTASRTLRRLEELGLVERGADVSDGRVARYRVTAAGRRVWKRFESYMGEQLTESMAHMSDRGQRQLADLLEQLVAGTRRQTLAEERSRTKRAKSSEGNGREK